MKLALIPARGGSKRIPRKNIKSFAGKPMISYAIKAAQDTGVFDRIVVSTDDPEVAEIAIAHGAEAPFERPADLANDTAPTVAVINHALNWFRDHDTWVDHVCCLYAASPFIQSADLLAAWTLLQSSGAEYVFPVTSFPFPIQRAVKIGLDGRLSMFEPRHLLTRSQDLEDAYHDVGQFYWGKAAAFLANKPLFGADAVPLVIPRWRVQDIDTLEDWERAEVLFEIMQRRAGIS